MKFDLIISGGMVVDGTGASRQRTDIGIWNGVWARGVILAEHWNPERVVVAQLRLGMSFSSTNSS